MYQFSLTGSHHASADQPNQDIVRCLSTDGAMLGLLADGVSTCPRSQRGAILTTDAFCDLFRLSGQGLIQLDATRRNFAILGEIRSRLQQQATTDGAPVQDYSSTAAALYWTKDRLFFWSLGDSLLVFVRKGRCLLPTDPRSDQDGCVCTTTEGAEYLVQHGSLTTEGLERAVAFSDGAWHALVQRGSLTPAAQRALRDPDPSALAALLTAAKPTDDCSFVLLDAVDLSV